MKRLVTVLLCLVFAGGVFWKVSAESLGVGAVEPEVKKEAAGAASEEKAAAAEKENAPAAEETLEDAACCPASNGCEAAAAYLKSASYAENNLTAAAEKALGEIIEKYPDSWWAEISCVKLSKMKLKAGKNEEGIKLLEDFSVKYKGSLLAEKAEFNLCVAYVLNKNEEKAAERLEKFIVDYPSSENFAEARKLLKKVQKK